MSLEYIYMTFLALRILRKFLMERRLLKREIMNLKEKFGCYDNIVCNFKRFLVGEGICKHWLSGIKNFGEIFDGKRTSGIRGEINHSKCG